MPHYCLIYFSLFIFFTVDTAAVSWLSFDIIGQLNDIDCSSSFFVQRNLTLQHNHS